MQLRLYFTLLADIDGKRSKISTKSCPSLQRIYWIPVCKIKFIYSKEQMINQARRACKSSACHLTETVPVSSLSNQ